MKNFLKLCGLPLLLVCILLPLLASCTKCEHKDTEWEYEVDATCSVAGTRVRICKKCGAEVHREQYETAHQYNDDNECIYCGGARYGSEYLEYREITLDGEAGYEVVGRGNSTAKVIEIPALRNGKPVLSVAARAFANNLMITSVTFGKNVKRIGEKAFYGCTELGSATFSENSELAVIHGAAFEGCVRLQAFAVPLGVTEIPQEMLKGCAKLTSLTLHSGITMIGENALEGCDAIVYKEENGVRYLGPDDMPHLVLAGVTDKTVTAFTVPSDTRIIGTAAFQGCDALRDITLPEGVTSLSDYAFAACASLETLTLPTTLQNVGAYAFAGCFSLCALTVPAATVHIGEKAFYKCTSLTSLSLPAGIKKVGSFAFLQSALSFEELGGGKYLGNSENPYLVLVDTAAGVTELVIHEQTRVVASGALADSDCAALLSVEVGASVITLGAGAFVGCEALEQLTFREASGWRVAASYEGVDFFEASVTNGSTNADMITGRYKNYYWYR